MKKQINTFLAIFSLLFLILPLSGYSFDLTLNNTPVQVYFSPNGGAAEAIIREIDKAKTEILVQAYSFTSLPIAKAMLLAHKRGVNVQAIMDKSQRGQKYTSANFLANVGIPTFIDDKHTIAHNKIMIIDRETVITGSYNFSKSAEKGNAENLLIIKSKELAKIYLDNWNRHREHSEPYQARY